MTTIRPASGHDRGAVAATLANAFAEDPLFRWFVGPKAPLEARLRIFYDSLVGLNLRKPDHMVFTTDEGAGAAIWQPIDKWKVPPADLVRGMPALLRAFRGRVPKMAVALTKLEKAHPKEPHYYLEMLGTRQGSQSKGVGTAVIRHVLDRCDEEGVPAYLESSNRRNVPFYARHGFVERDVLVLGTGAPPLTPMWREPR